MANHEVMKISLKKFSEGMNKTFIVNKAYQRSGGLWPKAKKRAFIERILSNSYTPEIVLRKVGQKYEIVEGQQRSLAIHEFIEGKYNLSGGEKTGVYFSTLDSDYKKLFTEEDTIRFVVLNEDESAVRKTFLDLNSGKNLNSAEKRHSVGGEAMTFVHDIVSGKEGAEYKKILERFKFAGSNRFSKEDTVFRMLAYECIVKLDKLFPPYSRSSQANGILDKFVHENHPELTNAKAMVKAIIQLIGKMFPAETDMPKTSLIDLYILTSNLINQYRLDDNQAKLLGERLMSRIYKQRIDMSTGTKMTARLIKLDTTAKSWMKKNSIKKKV